MFFISLAVFPQNAQIRSTDSLTIVIEKSSGKEKLASIVAFCEKNNRAYAEKTIEFASLGIELADQFNDLQAKAQLMRFKGVSAYTLGDMDNSLNHINEAINLSNFINDSINLGKSYRILGTHYFVLGDFEKSREQINKALHIAEAIHNAQMIYDAKRDIARNYLGQGLYSKSLESYEEIFALCENHSLDCTAALFNKAIAIHNVGRPSDALGHFFEARKVFVEKEDYSSAALVEHHIGYLLEKTKLYKEALYYYDSVKEFYEKSGNVNRLSAIYLNMGSLMVELNKLDEAEIYLQKALQFKKENGIKTVGDVFIDLGLVALKKENYNLSFDYFKKAHENYEALDDKADIGVVYRCFSMSYLKINEYQNAEKYALESLKINKQFDISREIVFSYENLIKAYEAQDKFDLAFQSQKQLDVINEDLKGSNELLAITKKLVTETLSENEENYKEATILANAGSTSKSSNRTFYWVFALLILLLMSGGFYYVKQQKKSSIENAKKINYLQKNEVELLLKQLHEVIETKKPYFKEDLTLKELASAIKTTDKKLSILLNQHLNTNFYDYINAFRIKEFKAKIESDIDNRYSIIGVAHDCGFKSKSSFYRAFKKETGISPSIYKAQKAS